MQIRPEQPQDHSAIAALTSEAFRNAPHSGGNEAAIIEALRADQALILSLVAEAAGGAGLTGHISASRCRIGTADQALIAPVSVLPAHQGQGIGSALIRAALEALRLQGWPGVALVGDPAFYARFGFQARPGLSCEGIPAEYVQSLSLGSAPAPVGPLILHPAFFTA